MARAKQAASSAEIIPIERIASRIFIIRGQKVMLDSDLAALYRVTTGNLNLAFRRNERRFPEDFVFALSDAEFESLLLQNAIAKAAKRVLEFFTAQINNDHTRKAYLNATQR
jgi:hypothetical protein